MEELEKDQESESENEQENEKENGECFTGQNESQSPYSEEKPTSEEKHKNNRSERGRNIVRRHRFDWHSDYDTREEAMQFLDSDMQDGVSCWAVDRLGVKIANGELFYLIFDISEKILLRILCRRIKRWFLCRGKNCKKKAQIIHELNG